MSYVVQSLVVKTGSRKPASRRFGKPKKVSGKRVQWPWHSRVTILRARPQARARSSTRAINLWTIKYHLMCSTLNLISDTWVRSYQAYRECVKWMHTSLPIPRWASSPWALQAHPVPKQTGVVGRSMLPLLNRDTVGASVVGQKCHLRLAVHLNPTSLEKQPFFA